MIFDAAGNLYGTTESGGAYDFGTVFELTPKADGSWKEKVLHDFTGGKDEGSPGSLIFDAAGSLYGTTYAGGFHSWGTVFELSPKPNGSWTQRVLHRFTGGQDGAYPFGLIFDQAGSLYGTTLWGGDPNYCTNNPPLGCGVVFKLVPKSNGGWNETVLRYFFDHPGAHPLSELILDATGNLYGTTSGDDSGKRNGTVFEVTP